MVVVFHYYFVNMLCCSDMVVTHKISISLEIAVYVYKTTMTLSFEQPFRIKMCMNCHKSLIKKI